jgi:hypothetical protein
MYRRPVNEVTFASQNVRDIVVAMPEVPNRPVQAEPVDERLKLRIRFLEGVSFLAGVLNGAMETAEKLGRPQQGHSFSHLLPPQGPFTR